MPNYSKLLHDCGLILTDIDDKNILLSYLACVGVYNNLGLLFADCIKLDSNVTDFSTAQ